jgi:bacillithiol system protein YtxJ
MKKRPGLCNFHFGVIFVNVYRTILIRLQQTYPFYEKQIIGISAVNHHLDLLAYLSLSNKVAEQFDVHHESPQILIIRNGSCVYDESHLGISVREIVEQATAA